MSRIGETLMTIIWTPKMLMRLQELTEEREQYGDPSARQMADILTAEFDVPLTKDIVNHTIVSKINLKEFELDQAVYLPTYAKYNSAMHTAVQRTLPANLLAGHKKILHLCDLHIPFHNVEAIATALRANATADILVVSELMDLGSQSTWDVALPVPIEVEIEETLKMLELLSANFETIIVIKANHDTRVQRRIIRALPSDLQLMLDEFNLIDLLVRPFKNIFLIQNWWMQLGDVIFCHASKSIGTHMRTADELDSYFRKHGDHLKIEQPFRVLVQAHTHRLGTIYGANTKMFEGGMLCCLPTWYLAKPVKMPWATGYISLELEDGKAVLNRCREVYLPSKICDGLSFEIIKAE